jgi:hypothetical protein
LGEREHLDDKHPRLSAELLDAITAAATRIRQEHKADLNPATADRAARKFRLMLTPRRRKGRPRSIAVAIAIKLRRQGKPWREIYASAIAGFDELDRAQRWYRCYNLRQNVNRILKRTKGKVPMKLASRENVS